MKLDNIIAILFISFTISTAETQNDDTNAFDEAGRTLLLNAVVKSDVEEVKDLIKSGSDVNLKEKNGLQGSPLMYAASTGNLEICKLLKTNGARVNDVDINNDHALNWASFSGKKSTVKYLLENGADVSVKSKHGNALDVALRLWHGDSIRDLFRKTKLAKDLSQGAREITSAVETNKISIVENLLKQGISPNTKDELDIPILQIAAEKGLLEMTKLLIKQNADINILNRVGQTPIAWAARNSNVKVIHFLLESGAKVNHTGDEYRLTPLIAAAINGNRKVGKLLLEAGANIEHTDIINNATALHWSLFYGNQDFAKTMITNGANYNRKVLNNNMYSAKEMVDIYKMDELSKFIEEYGVLTVLNGSYKVKEIHYIYKDTIYKVNNLDYGRFIFSEENYALQYNPMMAPRVAFKVLSNPEPNEIDKAFKSVVFNSGKFKVEKDVIHTEADIAKVPGFEGGHQYYRMTLQNNTLTSLTMFDETYPNGQKPEWYGKLEVKFVLVKE